VSHTGADTLFPLRRVVTRLRELERRHAHRLTVTAAIVASLLIDHFGWLRMEQHSLTLSRALGGLPLVGGVVLVARR
jgi:uncharacterized membrane protein YdcZ (DUF606 family)